MLPEAWGCEGLEFHCVGIGQILKIAEYWFGYRFCVQHSSKEFRLRFGRAGFWVFANEKNWVLGPL